MIAVPEADTRDVLDSIAFDVIEGALGNTSEAFTGIVKFNDPLGGFETRTSGVLLARGI